jgi:hypothetical protein
MNIASQPWSAEADAGLAKAMPDAVIRSIVQAEVERGISKLWRCEDGEYSAWVVTRLDDNPPEWVIVAFEGTGMHRFGRHFVQAAKTQRVTLRAHVTNPVVERLLRPLGLRRSEVILRASA